MRREKNTIFSVLLISCLHFFMACGSGDSGTNNDPLLFWSANNAQEIEFARKVIADWNRANPEDPIKFQPIPEGQSSEEIILAAVVGETTPDIYANMWQGEVEFYAKAKILVPLDTMEGFLEFIYQRCDSARVQEVTSSDGHIYQIPWKINPIMMDYNMLLLDELGYAPRTYSEYLEVAKNYREDTDGDGYPDRWAGYLAIRPVWSELRFTFYTFYLAASGGAPLLEGNKPVFNNPRAIEVLAFLKSLYDRDYFTKERLQGVSDPFLNGKIMTEVVGPWDISQNNKFKADGFDYEFHAIPVPDDHQGPVYTYGDAKNIVIFNTCKKPEIAWKFLKTLISEENDLFLLELSNQIPPRKDLLTNPLFVEVFTKNEKLTPFAQQALYIKGVDNNELIKEVFDILSQEYQACVIYGMKSPEEALRDAEEAVEVLFLNM